MLQSLRSRPYLILLPLGTLIALHGLGMWLAHYASSAMPYPGQEHVLIQLGCYSVCVISALIFSLIPQTWNARPLGSFSLWLISATAIVLMFAARRSEFLSLALLALLFFTVLLLLLKGVHTGSGIRIFDSDSLYSVLAFASGAIGSTLALLIVSGLLGENWPVWKKMADGLIFGAFPVLALFGLVALAQRSFADEKSSVRQDGERVFGGMFGAGLAIALALSYVFEPLASESHNTLFDSHQLLLILRAALAGTILLVQFNILRAPHGQHPTERSIWLALWLVFCGFVFSSALPEYRIAWEHVTFIAGLVWIPLAVFVELRRREKSPEVAVEYGRRATIWYGLMIFLALITRVTTDIWTEMRLFHLALAALFAIIGLTIWVVVFFPFKRSR